MSFDSLDDSACQRMMIFLCTCQYNFHQYFSSDWFFGFQDCEADALVITDGKCIKILKKLNKEFSYCNHSYISLLK